MRNKKTIKECGVYYVVLLKVTLYLIRLSAAVQAAELQIDTAGSI